MRRTVIYCLWAMFLPAGCTGPAQQEACNLSAPAAENCSDTSSANKIKRALSVQKVMDMTDEEVREWEAGPAAVGLQSYEVDTTFNAHCLLSVTVAAEWLGAYPSGWQHYFNFDKRTGYMLRLKDLLRADRLDALVKDCNERLAANVAAARESLTDKNELEDFDNILKETPPVFTRNNIDNFYLTRDGMVIIYRFNFPHYVLALEPNGIFHYSVEALRPHIKPGGPLAFWLNNKQP